MEFVITDDARRFHDAAWPLLETRRDCNVLASGLLAALEGRYRDVETWFAYRRDSAGDVVTAALRMAPFPMLCSALASGEAMPLLDAWMSADPGLPGINGLPDTARSLAAAWSARTGGTTEVAHSMAMHALSEVVDAPHQPPGALRTARASERDLLVEWWQAFAREAHAVSTPSFAEGQVQARLQEGGALLWEDRGPVCLVAIGPSVAGVPRIGPVYTPPEHRRNGYAAAAVAEVSRRALASGAPQVMLFTDLANPTANKIYAEVGYRRFGAWEEYAFRP